MLLQPQDEEQKLLSVVTREEQLPVTMHNANAEHKYSQIIRKNKGSKITNALSKGHVKALQEKREYMRAVVESLRFTVSQKIAQSSHREDENSGNRCNFIKLLHLVGKFDKTIEKERQSPKCKTHTPLNTKQGN